jgi:hypothetical protein
MRKFRGAPPCMQFTKLPRDQAEEAPAVLPGGLELRPVYGEDGEVQLHDIFRDGEWCGSRRTQEQCRKVMELQQSVGTD